MSAHPFDTYDLLSDHPRQARRFPNRNRLPRNVAVLSDGSGLTGPDPAGKRASVESALHAWMTSIQERTGLTVRAVNMISSDVDDLRTRLHTLPADLAGVVVIETRPDHLEPIYAWAQNRECAVLTEPSLTAVTATAALLTSLKRQGHPPGRSHVVITGAATLPMLSQLLITSGIGEVTRWNRDDALSFPLRRIASRADAVIDLLDCAHEMTDAVSAHPELIVLAPDRIDWALIALPGLLTAVITASPPAATVETCYASALALVAATPPERLLPQPAHLVLPTGRWNPTTSTTIRGGIPWRQRSLRSAIRRARPTGIAPGASVTSASVTSVRSSRADHHTRFIATPRNPR